MSFVEEFVSRVAAVAGGSSLGLHEPLFKGNEKRYLSECVDSGFVSSVGAFVDLFESKLKGFTGAEHAVALVNGTAALHLGLMATGVRAGDEVVVPALSFVATANAVVHAGATPHFVDVNVATWGLCPVALRQRLIAVGIRNGDILVNKQTGRRISAIVPMHALGHPAQIEEIMDVAAEFGLVVVEDSAESLGSFVSDRHTGLFGAVGVFSFNGNKTITTGGGGAVVTRDADLAAQIRHISTTARLPHSWDFDHDQVGYNYRMPNINAALGVAQIERLAVLVALQRNLFLQYSQALEGFSGGNLKKENCGASSNFWLQAFLLDESKAHRRDEVIESCIKSGLKVRPLWKPLNSLTPFLQSPSASTPVSESLYQRAICLPSSAVLGSVR